MAENLRYQEHRERRLGIILLREAEQEVRHEKPRKKRPTKAKKKLVWHERDPATKAWILASHKYHARIIAEAMQKREALRQQSRRLAS